ncbi:unnamed protein product [Thlaspi arvense]|uniref:Myb-like domain-containing protein n=1 Tax=Thlaspi arvense TaxID=13288 RepID=A0AAU9R8F9_THLAR|nr:unnamed protein product [Thlaspi arvense]
MTYNSPISTESEEICWNEEEDQILVDAHKVSGTTWTEIAQQLSGRSENAIKNH